MRVCADCFAALRSGWRVRSLQSRLCPESGGGGSPNRSWPPADNYGQAPGGGQIFAHGRPIGPAQRRSALSAGIGFEEARAQIGLGRLLTTMDKPQEAAKTDLGF